MKLLLLYRRRWWLLYLPIVLSLGLLLAVVALLYGRPDFLDLALAYALINFIGILAILQFVQNRKFSALLRPS